MLDQPHYRVVPNIHLKPHLVQPKTISSHPITCHLREETETLFPAISFLAALEPPLLQKKTTSFLR